MSILNVVGEVDGQRIYKHVMKLEGAKHPIASPQKLNQAADYILSELKQYGLATSEQKFKVPGFDGTFWNVEGLIKGGDGSELLIGSHYDTVENSPGANDNASGVAVMLEAARLLSKREDIHNVCFVSFTLEEGNPAFALKSREATKRLGLRDENDRYTSLEAHNLMRKFWQAYRKYWATGNNPSEAIAKAKAELETNMSEAMVRYVEEMQAVYEGISATSWPGKTGCMGSSFWVEEALKARRKVSGMLCLETIGYTSDQEGSQHLPRGMKPEMYQTSKAVSPNVGNFLAIMGDVNSGRLIQQFFAQSQHGQIDLPCASLQVPFRFEQIAMGMGDLLRSDHAPFWRQGIPALFLTDTADFRYPYYHTPADTIDKLDFDFITKTCKATIATTISLTSC
jgi:hypothetical protein